MARGALVIALVASGLLAVGISAGSHMDSDDTMYAQIAREMVESGDWIDTAWTGVVVFEKPPLYFWAMAASGVVFGWGEAAMRLPGTLFSVAGLLFLWILVRTLGMHARAAGAAVALLATSYLWLMLTRRLMTDVPLCACVLGAAAALANGRVALFGLGCGLAAMVKGLGAGPPVLALVIWGLWDRRLSVKTLLLAAVLGVLVALPWHLAMSWRYGAEFWQGYIGYHIGERVISHVVPGLSLTELLSVVDEDRLLWLGALAGIGQAMRRRALTPVGRFALVWSVITALPPLLMTTRLPQYWLPVLPGLVLLTVCAVPREIWSRRLSPAYAAIAIVLTFAFNPVKFAFWLGPDFDPTPRVIGEQLGQNAAPEDVVVAWNVMSNSLIWYSGGLRLWMVATDPRFYEVQEAVLAIRRTGVLTSVLPRPPPGARLFVVARPVDVPAVAAAMRSQAPARRIFIADYASLVLLNDANVGFPLESSP